MDIRRMQRLAGLDEGHAEDEEEMAQSDARYEREQRIKQLILYAFRRLGLAINTDASYPLWYDEDSDREATVTLDDEPNGHSLKALVRLLESGLADDYQLHVSRDGLEIRFKVALALDNVTDRN